MAEPSFNGVNFFGPCPSSRRIELPNARQINAYPGVAGVEVIELGIRTAYTEFTGLWITPYAGDLGPFITEVINIKRNAGFATLVDTKGVVSPDAIFETFETTGETKWHPGFGWGCPYVMRFLHIGVLPT